MTYICTKKLLKNNLLDKSEHDDDSSTRNSKAKPQQKQNYFLRRLLEQSNCPLILEEKTVENEFSTIFKFMVEKLTQTVGRMAAHAISVSRASDHLVHLLLRHLRCTYSRGYVKSDMHIMKIHCICMYTYKIVVKPSR